MNDALRHGSPDGAREGALAGAFWPLDPRITFLNHGSFGACPRPVQAAQRRWRDRIEADPIDFLVRRVEGCLDEARGRVASFVRSDPAHLAFVANATTGISTVLRSLRFEPGDELLANDHEYPSAINALRMVCERDGARLVTAEIPFPIRDAGQVTAAVLAAVTPRTRLALISHVTSGTALVFPVAELVEEMARLGVPTLVDGAHAPGMLPLELDRLGATWYVGNGHKWLCGPKGSAFVHVHTDRQGELRSLVVSHGAQTVRSDRSRFRLEHDWPGLIDMSAWLALPAAIDVLGDLLPGGWPELMAANQALATVGRDLVCDRLGVEHPAPDGMLGAMALVPLQALGSPPLPLTGAEISDRLYERYGIEIPVGEWPRPERGPSRCYARLSAQRYNRLEQYSYLADAVREILDDAR